MRAAASGRMDYVDSRKVQTLNRMKDCHIILLAVKGLQSVLTRVRSAFWTNW